jgi:hypothetical protein
VEEKEKKKIIMNFIEELVELAERRDDKELGRLLGELLIELQKTFGWMVVSTKDKFDNEFGDGNYSPELKKAMEYLGL